MADIASIMIERSDAISAAFDKKRLYQTRQDQNGALNRLLAFIKSEDVKTFSASNARIGGAADDFVFVYYANGIRYKIFKDGSIMISSGDAEERFPEQERQLEEIIAAIISDELYRAVCMALAETGAKISKAKILDNDENGIHSKIVCGIATQD